MGVLLQNILPALDFTCLGEVLDNGHLSEWKFQVNCQTNPTIVWNAECQLRKCPNVDGIDWYNGG